MSVDTTHNFDPALAEALQTQDWLESLDHVLASQGPERVEQILKRLQLHAQSTGMTLPVTSQTPYVNTIKPDLQAPYPGNLEIERRIKSIVRWNAMAMVVRANRNPASPGGHISTFASSATLYEVGQNHFYRGRDHECGGDAVYFQGHASPGMYSRAFLEGRLSEENLINFRRELQDVPGLSSYPHPWLMPDFWQYPTVSMGLGPLQAIYHARFMRYLDDRGIKEYKGAKVWAYLGDGECDEPETLGAISLPAREKLDNLIFVINCNLQRLDGPVRGNGKIIQELEASFRGAGWNVIKVLWGSQWDDLFKQDTEGRLANRLMSLNDGQVQRFRVEDGAYMRKEIFGGDPQLEKMVANISDDELWHMKLGGHDPRKIYAAYKSATEHTGAPTLILAHTIKGYGLGEAGEGKNITHQQKKLNEQELLEFRDRFDIPISDAEVGEAPFYKPEEDSMEMQYLRDRRAILGGYVPKRTTVQCNYPAPPDDQFGEFFKGSDGKPASTTFVFVRILNKLLKDKTIGKYIVPIIPDEARTFGMDGLFRQVGIYSHVGQNYEPVDSDQLSYYKEATDGQILEEGINEAGAMCSFIAAGTSHANNDVGMIPFYIYYSMFGFQRIGDLVWAAGDLRTRGFLLGGTAGRTTLNGEGLQHQDGHSHVLFSCVPNVICYDPTFNYELAVIIKDGIQRMYVDNEDVFYYLTVGNEGYAHPPMPEGAEEGILKGMYKFSEAPNPKAKLKAQLLGSGSIMNEVIEAQKILAEKYDVAADIWGVTSYTELRRDALEVERYNMLNPDKDSKTSYVADCLNNTEGVIVAASDYMKILPDGVSKWVDRGIRSLGTDGFGRSEGRAELREHFEVNRNYIVLRTLRGLVEDGQLDAKVPVQAIKDLNINPDKRNPLNA